ncbi:MAG TPA: hypothetical protein VFE47_19695, partial [Tepidisphaeraceae bacterium]|nr:hypothetical protein [Tepidisphaeraceae bacterium]
ESGTFALNGRVIIAGGQNDNFQATANIVEYDPATNVWALLPPLPRPLEGVIVQRLGDRLFVTGGYIGANSVATSASYGSNPFTGAPNSRPPVAQQAGFPFDLVTLLALTGVVVLVGARRNRKTR